MAEQLKWKRRFCFLALFTDKKEDELIFFIVWTCTELSRVSNTFCGGVYKALAFVFCSNLTTLA